MNTASVDMLNKNRSASYSVYTDQESGGKSTASVTKTASGDVVFSYVIREGYPYPYTGVCFNTDSGMRGFGFNKAFVIELDMQVPAVIPVILNEYTTDHAAQKHIRPVQYELKTKAGTHTYTIPLSAFNVPVWWYKDNRISEQDLPAFDPAGIKDLCIQNSSLAVLNKNERVVIKDIRYAADNSVLIWIAVVFSVCWLTGSVLYKRATKEQAPVYIPYVATTTEEKGTDEWMEIRRYISANYMNDIDMEGMEKELGIARHKIAVVLKENTGLIFKQYLNQIKVAEAKRLLLETNLPVGEIADQVGFGHLSNFNRVFKQYTGESPSDLRKQRNS